MNDFSILQKIIRNRRSTKPADMNGKIIDNSVIKQLLELADWAPTHARTEPWRFVVYAGDAKQQFCADHANLYKTSTPEEKFTEAKYNSLLKQGNPVSHIVVVYMKRTATNPVPQIEETAAVAAAVEHILLGAESLGIATLWGTGGMTHHTAMKNYLQLAEEDQVMGLLYLGYTSLPEREGKRNIPLNEKITWK